MTGLHPAGEELIGPVSAFRKGDTLALALTFPIAVGGTQASAIFNVQTPHLGSLDPCQHVSRGLPRLTCPIASV